MAGTEPGPVQLDAPLPRADGRLAPRFADGTAERASGPGDDGGAGTLEPAVETSEQKRSGRR
jgi:hypothetical protein